MNRIRINIRVKEIDALGYKLISLYGDSADVKEDAYLQKMFDGLNATVESVTEAINRDKVECGLSELDHVRNVAIHELARALSGYAAVPVDGWRQPAACLKRIFDKYGLRIVRERFCEKSSSIKSLLMDLDTEQSRADIVLLPGVGECVRRLRDAEDCFLKKSIENGECRCSRRMRKTATALKHELLDVINRQLVPYLNTMVMVNPQVYGTFASKVGGLIDDLNAAIARRKNVRRRKADDEVAASVQAQCDACADERLSALEPVTDELETVRCKVGNETCVCLQRLDAYIHSSCTNECPPPLEMCG